MGSYQDAITEAITLSDQLKPAYLSNFKAALDAVVPGASAQIASNLSSLLKGELSKEVVDQIRRTSAEANLSQGRFGEAAGNRTARDLGLTSVGLMDKGAAQLKALMPDMPNIQSLISGAFAGKEFDINAALGLGRLAEQGREFDISAELDRAKLDSQKHSTDVANEQFKATLASNLALNRERTATEKFMATLEDNRIRAAREQQDKQFSSSMDWDKQVSKFNQEFERFAQHTRQSNMQQTQANANQMVADKNAKERAEDERFRELQYRFGTNVAKDVVVNDLSGKGPGVVVKPDQSSLNSQRAAAEQTSKNMRAANDVVDEVGGILTSTEDPWGGFGDPNAESNW
jgi:hypothetical protein